MTWQQSTIIKVAICRNSQKWPTPGSKTTKTCIYLFFHIQKLNNGLHTHTKKSSLYLTSLEAAFLPLSSGGVRVASSLQVLIGLEDVRGAHVFWTNDKALGMRFSPRCPPLLLPWKLDVFHV